MEFVPSISTRHFILNLNEQFLIDQWLGRVYSKRDCWACRPLKCGKPNAVNLQLSMWFVYDHLPQKTSINSWLVTWNINYIFFHILGTIIPFDELIFFRGVGVGQRRSTTNQILFGGLAYFKTQPSVLSTKVKNKEGLQMVLVPQPGFRSPGSFGSAGEESSPTFGIFFIGKAIVFCWW